jgi:hypothetical protein
MKKFTCFLLLVMTFQSVKAQIVQPTVTKAELLAKSQSQRQAGFVLLGTGALVTIAGMATAARNMWETMFADKTQSSGTGAIIAGLSLMGGSIPLFILAGNNKRASLTYGNATNLLQPGKDGWVYKPSPQVQVTFTQTIF